jgi:hypothetical protein
VRLNWIRIGSTASFFCDVDRPIDCETELDQNRINGEFFCDVDRPIDCETGLDQNRINGEFFL